MMNRHTIALILALSGMVSLSVAQPIQPRVVSPADYIKGDTLTYIKQGLPGAVGVRYSRAQDSLYSRAMALNITSSSRFEHDARTMSATLSALNESQRTNSSMDAIMRTLSFPTSVYLPTAVEAVQHQIHIANAMYVPNMLLRPMGTGNLQVNFNQIANFFGFTEDVSPRIAYNVDETQQVIIVVYSTQAKVISTIFNGIQGIGRYEVVWNGRDDKGIAAPNGDYIAEVRLGTSQILRKRITIPTPK